MFTKHNPAGGGVLHCDNERIEFLIAQYQSSGDAHTLATIVDLTQNRALALIRFHKTTRYRSEAELLSDINVKLIKAVDKFNPNKGTAFTFMSQVMVNSLCTSVSTARKQSKQYVELNKIVIRQLKTSDEDRSGVDDITHRIKSGARTTLSDPIELATQRWYIDSFTADGFESRRHECANAAMAVHNLRHERSRELYDLTMLEVRRLIYDDLPSREPITAGRLVGTRAAWMTRYAHLMNQSEFTKFFVLVRDLSPFVILLVDPTNRSRRQDRSGAVTRKNLEFILRGHPDAVPLFRS